MAYTYKITKPKKPRYNVNRLPYAAKDEGLSGFVQGYPASDLEERFAKALYKLRAAFEFSVKIPRIGYLPTQENQIDFVVYGFGAPRPVEIDGEFAHKTAAQKGEDELRDALLSPVLADFGWNPITRIGFEKLYDEGAAIRAAREVLV